MSFLSPIFNSFEENCINTLYCLRDCLKVSVSNTTIRDTLKIHPFYPSLLSLSESLNQWNVETLSFRSTADQIPELPTPFIAHIRNEEGYEYFVVVKKIESDLIQISDVEKKGWRKISIAAFKKQWTGVVLFADPLDPAGEKEYKKKKYTEFSRLAFRRLAMAVLFTVCTVAGFKYFMHSGLVAWPIVLLVLTKMIGVYLGFLLLWFEIDHKNPNLKHVCSVNKKSGCHAILMDRAAKPLGLISWSEIGFFYFTGGLMMMLIAPGGLSLLQIVYWLSILAAPYIIFSVYYQWKVAKQWCRLCLGIQAILLIEVSLTVYINTYVDIPGVIIKLSDVGVSILAFLIPFLGWFLLKPYFIDSKRSIRFERELTGIKRNKAIFERLLMTQKPITPGSSGLGIVLGNPRAKAKIVKVCNPYCKPCSKSHAVIEDILHHHNNIQVQIIFVARNDDNDARSAPVKHFLALAEQSDGALLADALGTWYHAPDKNYDLFSERYKVQSSFVDQGVKLQAMNAWCKEAEITYTPVFFINGHKLPEIYDIEDIAHLLDLD